MKVDSSRRRFIKLSFAATFFLVGCGGSGSNTPSNGNNEESNNINPNKTKDKALVYLILNGGNDSFNMLVPTSTKEYNDYSISRSNLKIDKSDLETLNFKDKSNKTFGLHPSMPKTANLFNNEKLAFIANTAPLIQQVTKEQFQKNSVPIPLGLLSHADQVKHWQTLDASKRTNIGLFGRFADTFQSNKKDSQISMNLSLSGTNILQNGVSSTEYALTKEGSIGLKVVDNPTPLNNALKDAFNSIMNKSYSDSFEKTFIDIEKNAQTHHEIFKSKVEGINPNTFVDYSNKTTHINRQNSNAQTKYTAGDKNISEQFKMIAKAIKASKDLNMTKQTFYIDYYGWDHHDELTNNQSRMLSVVDDALDGFQKALEQLGIDDKVITVVGSDFGRTLSSNGNGTDHGWGGNMLVMGNDINGGKIYGKYPDLILGSNLDIGGGVLIPTTSIDEVFAELAYWFGIEKKDLKNYIPNIENFYDPTNPALPIGFLKV